LVAGPVAAAEDTYRIYAANEYGADISVIDTATDTVVATIPVSDRPGVVRPRGMSVSPDGNIIYVAVSDFQPQFQTTEDKIVAIDVRTNTVLRNYTAGGNPERVALNPAGTQIWASLEAIAQGAGYDVVEGNQFVSFRVGIEAEGVAVSLTVAGSTSPPRPPTWDGFRREFVKILKHILVGNRPRVVVFSNDGTCAYATAEIGGIDLGHRHSASTPSSAPSIWASICARSSLVVDPTGTRIVAGSGTNAIYAIDTTTNKIIATIKEKMGRRPWGVSITPDGRKVYTANGLSDSVSVIDTQCLCVVKNIQAGRARIPSRSEWFPVGNAWPASSRSAPWPPPPRPSSAAASQNAQQHTHDPFFENLLYQNQVYGLEMVGQRLKMAEAFRPPVPKDLVPQLQRMERRDFARFRGTLAKLRPALASGLTAALREVMIAVQAGQPVEAQVAKARALLDDAAGVVIDQKVKDTPAFKGAVLANLLLANDGVAEAFEDSIREVWGFPNGWASVRRVEVLWGEIAPLARPDQRAEVSGILDLLKTSFYPRPEPKIPFPKEESEDVESLAHQLVSIIEVTDATLYWAAIS
jgi:YVTN family beta-propeller protein